MSSLWQAHHITTLLSMRDDLGLKNLRNIASIGSAQRSRVARAPYSIVEDKIFISSAKLKKRELHTMPADPATVSYIFSTVASVGKIFETLFALSKVDAFPTPEEFENIEREANEDGRRRAAAAVSASDLPIMSGELVEAIGRRMQNIIDEMKKTVENRSLSRPERTIAMNMSRGDYCWCLDQIKSCNGGDLPEDLQKEWQNNECDKYI